MKKKETRNIKFKLYIFFKTDSCNWNFPQYYWNIHCTCIVPHLFFHWMIEELYIEYCKFVFAVYYKEYVHVQFYLVGPSNSNWVLLDIQ